MMIKRLIQLQRGRLVPGVGVELEALCGRPSPQPKSRCNRDDSRWEMVPGVGVEPT